MFLKSKQDYQEKLFNILNPVLPHYSSGKARLMLGYTGAAYSNDIAEMEGFIRVLWGLAPYFSGGGNNKEFEDYYLEGLTHGTAPENAEYWGKAGYYDQRFVEMAAIAVALLLAPEKLWEPLTETAKSNLASWLGQIDSGQLRPGNWQFFGVLVNVALKKLGCKEFSQEDLDQCLENINQCYVGNGWYKDGAEGAYDYYVAFALHYYGLIYSVFMGEEDPVNSQNFKERAVIFGKQFVYWFDETGMAIPYGRSLTYRFAQVAFYSACVYANVEPLDMATMKGIIDRNLYTWWQSHMQSFSGILTIGYEYPDLIMAEPYNAPGSPLWALKTFLLLALEDDHPYWSSEISAIPKLDSIKVFPEAQMIVARNKNNAVLYPSGIYDIPITIGHVEEKYGKFAYSSKFGFSIHKGTDCLENMAPDNELVFEIDGVFFGKRKAKQVRVAGRTIISEWSPF